jgi:ribosome-associated toxin RatA of RatAB toxin-antitoxin module
VVHTVDAIRIRAPARRVFELACDVERWPEILPHYRRVRVLERRADCVVVEMAAWRPFGPLRWPTWWVSEMASDPDALQVRYRHVRGVTTGMAVVWRIAPVPGPEGVVDVRIAHDWAGPRWPLGGLIARRVIGPVFIHGIASRTLTGIRRHAEGAT